MSHQHILKDLCRLTHAGGLKSLISNSTAKIDTSHYTHDNFSGHIIDYVPTHIKLIYFEPNLTPYVQPLDAGIIRCVKAHYRKSFCIRAVDMDEAGEHDIYKINLLEIMLMVRQAWDAVTPETIANCWRHTGITE